MNKPTLSQEDKEAIVIQMDIIWKNWDNEGMTDFQKAKVLAEWGILYERERVALEMAKFFKKYQLKKLDQTLTKSKI